MEDKLKIKKQKAILKTVYPKISTEQALKDVIESKALCREIYKRFGEFTTLKPGRNSLKTKTARAQTELQTVNNDLKNLRRTTLRKLKVFDKKWNELTEKEKLLKDSQIKFDKFIKENAEKRNRAEKRIVEDKLLNKQRLENLNDLKDSYNYFHKVKQTLELKIKELKMYDDYMTSVVNLPAALSHNLKHGSAVLTRYDDLMASKDIVVEKHKNLNARLVDLNNKLLIILTKKELDMAGKRNTVANLESRFNKANQIALIWERVVSEILNKMQSKYHEIATVKKSIRNLFMQMYSRRNLEDKVLKNSNIQQQLVFIMMTFNSIKVIKNEASKLFTQEMQTTSNVHAASSAIDF